ncbi:MAG: hypothetical protein ACRC67_37475 [Inquilinus sp.]|uniref:hypothetical protein n=1 Tax=Inquilinus sp. TaxID=1932117 RepID=UPI003F2F8DE9
MSVQVVARGVLDLEKPSVLPLPLAGEAICNRHCEEAKGLPVEGLTRPPLPGPAAR